MEVKTESQKFLKITIPSGQTGRFKPSTPLELRADARIRQVSISATTHDPTTEISVFAGPHTLVDHLPDLQAYETAAHVVPETAPSMTQSDKIDAEALVTTAPASNITIIIAVSYWVV